MRKSIMIISALLITATPAIAEEQFTDEQAPWIMRATNYSDIGAQMSMNELGLWCVVEKRKPQPDLRACAAFHKGAFSTLSKGIESIKMTEQTIRNLSAMPSFLGKDDHLATLQTQLKTMQDAIDLLREHINEVKG